MAGKHDKVKDKDRTTIITPGFTGRCFLCGSTDRVAKHEAFGGPNRDKSKQDQLIYEICGPHHNLSSQGVHFNKELDLRLKKHAEKIWLEKYTDKTSDLDSRIKLFIDRYGKNYLDEEDIYGESKI